MNTLREPCVTTPKTIAVWPVNTKISCIRPVSRRTDHWLSLLLWGLAGTWCHCYQTLSIGQSAAQPHTLPSPMPHRDKTTNKNQYEKLCCTQVKKKSNNFVSLQQELGVTTCSAIKPRWHRVDLLWMQQDSEDIQEVCLSWSHGETSLVFTYFHRPVPPVQVK